MRWSSTQPLRSNPRRLIAAACVGLAILVARPAATPAPAEFALITSGAVPVNDLTLAEVRRIFLFKRTMWRPGMPVNVLLPNAGLPSRAFLLEKIYRMSDQDLRRYILERIFQAEIDFAPKVVASDQEAVSFVKSGRSIVAVVGAGTPGLGDVKVLRIDGKLPREAGYPLVEK